MVLRLSHGKKPDTRSLSMPALQGAFTLSGVAATLRSAYRLVVPDKIPYLLSGQAASLSVTGVAPSATALTFAQVPSLTDEINAYAAWGFTEVSGSRTFAGWATPVSDWGTINLHDDTEGDDLLLWKRQQQRGHTGTVPSGYLTAWRNYNLNRIVSDTSTNDGDNGFREPSNDYDHVYGCGAAYAGYLEGNSTLLARAESLGDLAIGEIGTTAASWKAAAASNVDLTFAGGRQYARWTQLFAWLTWATGKSKWAQWLDAAIEQYVANTVCWQESPSMGIVQGGWYHLTRDFLVAYPNWNGVGTAANYDAGRRVMPSFQLGIHGEALIRAYLLTGRADVRDKIVKIAQYLTYYAHDPSFTGSGGPFVTGYFGHTNGAHWRRDAVGTASYDASLANLLTFGYKLTGTAAMFNLAKTLIQKTQRWNELEPGLTSEGPQCTDTQIRYFADVRGGPGGDNVPYFNKGYLQYAYQAFENSGNPTTLDSNVPAYIRNLSAGSSVQLAADRMDAWQNFTGRFGEQWGVYAYSGGCYDTNNNVLLCSGGGHQDSNDNSIDGINIYSSETPTWTKIKAATTPPSVSNESSNAVETASNGDPAASHTWNQIVYDAYANKLVLCGLGSAAGQNGASFARFRLFNRTANTWDTISGSLQGAAESMYAAAFAYDEVGRQIIGRGGDVSQQQWYRYDCVGGTLTQLAPTGTGAVRQAGETACAIDPVRRYMIFVGGYGSSSPSGPVYAGGSDMVLVDLSTLSGTAVTTYARTLTGFPAALRSPKLALEFHPPTGSFVACTTSGALYRLIPPTNPFTGTWTFTGPISVSGAGLPATSGDFGGGLYGRFRWAPYPNDKSRGVFVMDVMTGSYGVNLASRTIVYKPNF